MHAAKGVGEPGGSGEAQLPGTHSATTCGAAAAHNALRGALGGLVIGLIWGIIQEKKFVVRNFHLVSISGCPGSRGGPRAILTLFILPPAG